MSLLFFDSFKNYNYLPLNWEEATCNCGLSIKNLDGRRNSGVLVVTSVNNDEGSDYLLKNFPSSFDEIIFGFAFKRIFKSNSCLVVDLCLNLTKQSSFLFNSTGILWYTNNIYNVSKGINYVFVLNTWYYVEIRVKIHNEFGEVEIKIDETTKLLLTNLNTSTISNYYINNIKLGILRSDKIYQDFICIEDFYILNTLGSYNNHFLGNCTITYLAPTSNGTYSQFLPASTFSGINNYDVVNDTTYSGSGTLYSNTYYEYSNLDDGGLTRTSGDLALVFNNTGVTVSNPMSIYMNENSYANYLWFRFSNISIPKNAKIINAYMVLNKLQETTLPDTNEQTIYAQKIGVPAPQVLSSSDFLSRKFTNNKYITTQGANASYCNISKVIQELVDQVDWQESNNSILLVSNIHYTNRGQTYIYVGYTSYEANNNSYHTNSPKLYIEWELPEENDVKYIYTENLNSIDCYYTNTVLNIPDIKGVSLNAFAKNVSGTNMYLSSVVISGSNINNDYTLLPKNRYKNNYFIFDEDPFNNSLWVLSSLLEKEFGFTTTSG